MNDSMNDTDHGFFANTSSRDDNDFKKRGDAIRRALTAGRIPTQQEMYGDPTTPEAIANHRIGYGAQGNIYDSEEHWQEQQRIWADIKSGLKP